MKKRMLVMVCGYLGRLRGVTKDGRAHVTLMTTRRTWIFDISEVSPA